MNTKCAGNEFVIYSRWARYKCEYRLSKARHYLSLQSVPGCMGVSFLTMLNLLHSDIHIRTWLSPLHKHRFCIMIVAIHYSLLQNHISSLLTTRSVCCNKKSNCMLQRKKRAKITGKLTNHFTRADLPPNWTFVALDTPGRTSTGRVARLRRRSWQESEMPPVIPKISTGRTNPVYVFIKKIYAT